MSKSIKISTFILRVALGWFFFYAGITKILNPEWTSLGFLEGAKTFSSLFSWFAQPDNIGWVNFLNEWGQLLIGTGLIFGALTRLASFAAILLMILYYLPGLEFPKVDHGFLIDDHIIYIFAFALMANLRAGIYWGVDRFWKKTAWWL
ncbi:DoxX family protein [Candidatus Peregrinibacteria bacterium]|nr:DoxX family protein [Candidatus Peregrinibacteria bacterium]